MYCCCSFWCTTHEWRSPRHTGWRRGITSGTQDQPRAAPKTIYSCCAHCYALFALLAVIVCFFLCTAHKWRSPGHTGWCRGMHSLAHGTKPAHHRRPPISVVLPCCCCLQLLFYCFSLIVSPRTSAQSNICCRCHSFLPRPFGAAQYLVLVNLITLFGASLAPPNNLFSFDVVVKKK